MRLNVHSTPLFFGATVNTLFINMPLFYDCDCECDPSSIEKNQPRNIMLTMLNMM